MPSKPSFFIPVMPSKPSSEPSNSSFRPSKPFFMPSKSFMPSKPLKPSFSCSHAAEIISLCSSLHFAQHSRPVSFFSHAPHSFSTVSMHSSFSPRLPSMPSPLSLAMHFIMHSAPSSKPCFSASKNSCPRSSPPRHAHTPSRAPPHARP